MAQDKSFSGFTREFSDRHIGPTKNQMQQMLEHLSYDSKESFFSKVIPTNIKRNGNLKISKALSEEKALEQLSQLSGNNQICKSWLGQGYANTFLYIFMPIMRCVAWHNNKFTFIFF